MGWADGFAFSSFGVNIGIRANQSGLCKAMQSVLPPGHRRASAGALARLYSLVIGPSHQNGDTDRINILYDGAQRLCRECELAPILKVLEAQIRRAVAEMAPRRVFVHAGVIEHRGRALVIPGSSMSGKSTLVAELIKLGATYYSDEFAVLDEKGMVAPFAKALSLRKPGSFDATDYDVRHFGAEVGMKSVPIGMVAVTRYAAGGKWRPRAMTPGQGALAMLSHAVAARRQPGRVIGTLNRAVASARVVKGIRGEASEAASMLLEALEAVNDA